MSEPIDDAAGSSSRRGWVIAVVIILAIVGWRAGTFDKALVNVGLNAKPCATNGFGATFCGDDLDAYRDQVVEPLQRAQDELDDAAIEAQRQYNDAADDQAAYEDCLWEWRDDPGMQARVC